jgi:hypothetical protein
MAVRLHVRTHGWLFRNGSAPMSRIRFIAHRLRHVGSGQGIERGRVDGDVKSQFGWSLECLGDAHEFAGCSLRPPELALQPLQPFAVWYLDGEAIKLRTACGTSGADKA